MTDRYLIQEVKCKKCGEDLSDYDMPLFMSDEDDLTLTCPKCKAKTKFWIEMKYKSKIVNKRSTKLNNYSTCT